MSHEQKKCLQNCKEDSGRAQSTVVARVDSFEALASPAGTIDRTRKAGRFPSPRAAEATDLAEEAWAIDRLGRSLIDLLRQLWCNPATGEKRNFSMTGL
jgi:hypothetical protein